MINRIKYEISRGLIGISLGANLAMVTINLWTKDYSKASIHISAFALLFVLDLLIVKAYETFLMRFEEAKHKSLFAEVMVQKLIAGNIDIQVTHFAQAEQEGANNETVN